MAQTAFHAGEMTGRSTGADDVSKLAFQEYGRYSVSGIDDYEKKLNQQTNDVQEIMRQSIASGYSFHSRVSFYIFFITAILYLLT